MRILGIDPGLHLTGYGCVDLEDDSHAPRLIEGGVIRLKRSESIASRLVKLEADLDELLTELAPRRIVVEKLYSHYRHVRTSILMAHARGVVLLAGERYGCEVAELAATEVKKSITGNGHATKEQMQRSVMVQCGLAEPPSPPDVADAIAIALCDARRLATSHLTDPASS